MVPLGTLVGIASLGVFGWDRLKDRRAKLAAEAAKPQPAPKIESVSFENGPADTAIFTRYDGEVRHFDPDVKAGIPALLDSRSVQSLQPAQLAETPEEARQLAVLGSFYLVVPLSEHLPNAGEVVRGAAEGGACVLGSLTLPHLAIGLPVPMVIAIGGAALERSADSGGEFAVLSAYRAPAADAGIVEDEPVTAGAATSDRVLAEVAPISTSKFDRVPAEHRNGSAKEQVAVLGSIFGVPPAASEKEST